MPTATIRERRDLGSELERIGVPRGVPVVVLIGGASGLDADEFPGADVAIRDAVARAVADVGGALVDGGTDAGVMRMAGAARKAAPTAFPLIGVVAAALLNDRGGSSGAPDALPEPNHSHLVIVPGTEWGDETRWLFDIAEWIADGRPARTVLVNGGPVSRAELEESVRRGIPALAIRGTGRAADAIGIDDFPDAPPGSYHGGLIEVADAHDVEGLRDALTAALRGA